MWSTIYTYLGAFVRWLFSFGKKRFKDILDVPNNKGEANDPVNIMSNELVNIVLGVLVFVLITLLFKYCVDGTTGL